MKKQTNKTEIINIRATKETKDMAVIKSEKAGYMTVSAWLTKLIQRAR